MDSSGPKITRQSSPGFSPGTLPGAMFAGSQATSPLFLTLVPLSVCLCSFGWASIQASDNTFTVMVDTSDQGSREPLSWTPLFCLQTRVRVQAFFSILELLFQPWIIFLMKIPGPSIPNVTPNRNTGKLMVWGYLLFIVLEGSKQKAWINVYVCACVYELI